MNYLLDTNILIWLLLNPEKLTDTYRQIISDNGKYKFVSSVNFWEISLKYSLGKLDLGDNSPEGILEECNHIGLQILSLEASQASSFHQLPKVNEHKDPFDRMIIWLAMQSGLTLLSSDSRMKDYKLHGLRVV